jgi:hypothetical protein
MRVTGRGRTALFGVIIAIVAALSSSVGEHVATGATPRTGFTIYALATRAQYVNDESGVTRAQGPNPFDADPPQPAYEKGDWPGNSVLFAFALYSDARLTKPIGSASYTCTFAFDRQATCEAFYKLEDGTLFAAGDVDFAQAHAIMAVTGGTGRYLGASGETVTSGPGTDPAVKNESHIAFTLLR